VNQISHFYDVESVKRKEKQMSQQEIMNGMQDQRSEIPNQTVQLLASQLETLHSVMGSQALAASEVALAEPLSTAATPQQDALPASTANPGQNQTYAGFAEDQFAKTLALIDELRLTQDEYMENLLLPGSGQIHADGIALAKLPPDNSTDAVLERGGGSDTVPGACYDDPSRIIAFDLFFDAIFDRIYPLNSAPAWPRSDHEAMPLAPEAERLYAFNGEKVINLVLGDEADNELRGLPGGNLFVGGEGNDSYFVSSDDEILEDAAAGNDSVIADISWTLGSNLENLMLAGDHALSASGNELDNRVLGNSASNVLSGGAGNDVLKSGAAGKASLYVGGPGNDSLLTGAGNDLILFNAGDGQDTVFSKDTGRKTLSLGGDFAYGDLAFSKDGNTLVLKLGPADQIGFADWYAETPSRSVVNLQVIAEAMNGFAAGGSDPLLDQKLERFDFAGLASAFDAARTTTPTLTDWALSNALSCFQQEGSDSTAIGGELAYQYGRHGSLAGVGLSAAQEIISDSRFGMQAQALRPLGEPAGAALHMR
jgi:hypothetical protein